MAEGGLAQNLAKKKPLPHSELVRTIKYRSSCLSPSALTLLASRMQQTTTRQQYLLTMLLSSCALLDLLVCLLLPLHRPAQHGCHPSQLHSAPARSARDLLHCARPSLMAARARPCENRNRHATHAQHHLPPTSYGSVPDPFEEEDPFGFAALDIDSDEIILHNSRDTPHITA